jgi:DNA primase
MPAWPARELRVAYPASFLDELRQRSSVAQIVGRRVRLTRRGREYLGLCPFHNEKTPSFSVSEDKGFYHCFGCGAHGSAIDFVMHSEGLTFPEAVAKLAAEAGLTLPPSDPLARARAERASTIAGVLERAAKWFEAQLASQNGGMARSYLLQRGLKPDTVARFRLGFAPASRSALKEVMLARGTPEALLLESGLLISPSAGGASYDRFRQRLIFPIADRRGRIIGFGGRTLGDDPAKYINSPETPLFHKGSSLYNLALAGPAARETGQLVVAEGYFDVIALVEAGIAHAVAPLGTALSEDQLQLLWRLVPEPVLCFDGDAAGKRAAFRIADKALSLLRPGRSLGFAMLPQGFDPDDLVRKRGAQAMNAALRSSLPLAEILWQRETEGRVFDTPERRAALQTALEALAARVPEPTVRSHYKAFFAERLSGLFGSSGRWRRLGTGRGQAKPRAKGALSQGGVPAGSMAPLPKLLSRRIELLLAVALRHPALLEPHGEEFASLRLGSPELDRLKTAILEQIRHRPGLDAEELKRHLSGTEFGPIVDRLAGPDARYLEAFARPAAHLNEAEAGFLDLLGRVKREARKAELLQAGKDLAEGWGEAHMRRLKALKEQENNGVSGR